MKRTIIPPASHPAPKRGPDPEGVEYRDSRGIWRDLLTDAPVSAERQARYEARLTPSKIAARMVQYYARQTDARWLGLDPYWWKDPR